MLRWLKRQQHPKDLDPASESLTGGEPQRKIHRCLGDSAESIPAGGLTFGPCYKKPEQWASEYKKAWKHVLEKSGQDTGATTECYISAIRNVEEKAKNYYADGVLKNVKDADFRWMMVEDGCFFLQLALIALGGFSYLSYDMGQGGMIFGKRGNRNTHQGWIHSMFFVGNQIPLVVLSELMKQSFFQRAVTAGKWNPPPPFDLRRSVLYEKILLPALAVAQTRRRAASRRLNLQRLNCIATRKAPIQAEEPITDILHALHSRLLGPGRAARWRRRQDTNRPESRGREIDDKDIESGTEKETNNNSKKFRSAMELKQKGISFEKSENTGTRGIRFRGNIFRGVLQLPVFHLEDDSEAMYKNLVKYEKSQNFDSNKREVSSYIRLMGELICTEDDAEVLFRAKIIDAAVADGGPDDHPEVLPKMFKSLQCEEEMTQHIGLIGLQIKSYSRVEWERYKEILSIVVFLTLVQTVFSILDYFKD